MKFSFRQMWTITSKEYKTYFTSPIAYIMIAGFLLIMDWMFFFNLDHVNEITMQYKASGTKVLSLTEGIVRPLYGSMNVIFLFITPFITMRLFAEERKMQTIQLLMTSPVSVGEMVFGKFLSSVMLITTMLLLTLIYPVILVMYGNPDLGPIFTNYLGIFLMACCYLSTGIFFSATSENQIAAGAMTFAAGFFFWLVHMASQSAGPFLQVILEYLSLTQHFNKFNMGIVNSSDVIFYLSYIGLGLFFTHRVMDSYRWRD